MARPLRNWRCGEVYHVYQRGNRRQNVFPNRSMYLIYIQRLFLIAKRYSVRVHAFCCMPNHVHLILEPTRKGGLSNFMRDLQSYYARLLHVPTMWDGHAWKHHYGCKRLSAAHYRTAVWYVEHNPVKAKLAKRAEDWEFSSASAHVNGQPVVLTGKRKRQVTTELYWRRWEQEFANTDWRAWLRSPADEALRQRIQEVEKILGTDRARFAAGDPSPKPKAAVPHPANAEPQSVAAPKPITSVEEISPH